MYPNFFGQRQGDCLQGYGTREMVATSPEQMVIALTELRSQEPGMPLEQVWRSQDFQTPSIADRHLLICTHGSHNECCGIEGYPLYQAAIALTKSLKLHHTHIWQVSHIGGHRYAPTLIGLLQGRYYGKLNNDTLETLLHQRGTAAQLDALMNCYRGWSLLPKALQKQEKAMLCCEGWAWLTKGSWQQVQSREVCPLYPAPGSYPVSASA